MKQQNRDAAENSASNPLMCVYLGTVEVGSGEQASGMWTRSGGKRCELRELQESHREGSLCSTGNTTVVRWKRGRSTASYSETSTQNNQLYLQCSHFHRCPRNPSQTFIKWEKKTYLQCVRGKINSVMFRFMRAFCGTHSVLKRRLMEFIHGGNGNVDSLFISFALSSVCSYRRRHTRINTLIPALS